ncbi:hypothetical protein R3P38DRAFT_892383 [Favolaschia claudopus]|uniref:Zinc finger PHD-type domain-containing protein n=1 Tax=Favolaschia claudopus TaxID=2862362 RepID=A0AAW0BVG5_9AGAR
MVQCQKCTFWSHVHCVGYSQEFVCFSCSSSVPEVPPLESITPGRSREMPSDAVDTANRSFDERTTVIEPAPTAEMSYSRASGSPVTPFIPPMMTPTVSSPLSEASISSPFIPPISLDDELRWPSFLNPTSGVAVQVNSICYTCRIRGVICDGHQNVRGQCNTCVSLRLECLGFGTEWPHWLHNDRQMDEVRDKIEAFIAVRPMNERMTTRPTLR